MSILRVKIKIAFVFLLGSGQCQEKPFFDDVKNSIGDTIHISGPFFERPENIDVYDGKFLPVVQHPGTSFIHMGPDVSAAVQQQMNQLLNVIPFVIILALFVIIIGMLAWIFVRTLKVLFYCNLEREAGC